MSLSAKQLGRSFGIGISDQLIQSLCCRYCNCRPRESETRRRYVPGLLTYQTQFLLSGHLTAFGGTIAAVLGAFFTMLRIVLVANLGAVLTNLCAKAADLWHTIASASHSGSGKAAGLRDIQVSLDAIRHGTWVWFRQARGGAVITGCCAGITGVDAALILFVSHDDFLFQVRFANWRSTEVSAARTCGKSKLRTV